MKNNQRKVAFLFVLTVTILILSSNTHMAQATNDYSYGAQIDPIDSRFVVKPEFKNIESRISIKNTGEDALFHISAKEKTKSISPDILYLDKEQKWSEVSASPILIKKNESRMITLVMKSTKQKLNEGDYYVETAITILPTYIPLTLDKYVQIRPNLVANTTVSVTSSGYTKVQAKVAHFTNLTGNIIMSNTEPNIVLLVQNLDKYSLFVKGTVQIKKDLDSQSIDLFPTNIRANNQAYLTNVANGQEKNVKPNKKLSWGKYSVTAQLSTANSNTPTVFASFDLWVVPIGTIYFISITLIIVLITAIFIYHFHKTHNYG